MTRQVIVYLYEQSESIGLLFVFRPANRRREKYLGGVPEQLKKRICKDSQDEIDFSEECIGPNVGSPVGENRVSCMEEGDIC